jgi:hypothetical protein
LKKYKAMEPTISFTQHVEEDEIYAVLNVLKKRINKIVEENGVDPNLGRAASRVRTLYYFTIIGYLVLSGSYNLKGYPLESFMLALFIWLVGCPGQDAGHFAAGCIPILNDTGLWTIGFLCN